MANQSFVPAPPSVAYPARKPCSQFIAIPGSRRKMKLARGETVRVTWMDYDGFKQVAAVKRFRHLATLRDSDGRIIITAPTKALQLFVPRYAKNKETFRPSPYQKGLSSASHGAGNNLMPFPSLDSWAGTNPHGSPFLCLLPWCKAAEKSRLPAYLSGLCCPRAASTWNNEQFSCRFLVIHCLPSAIHLSNPQPNSMDFFTQGCSSHGKTCK